MYLNEQCKKLNGKDKRFIKVKYRNQVSSYTKMNVIKYESKIVLQKEERNQRWYKCVEELHQKVSKTVDLTELETDILESEVKGPVGNFANNAAELMINQQNCLKFYQIMLLNWCLQCVGRYGKPSSRPQK